VDKQEGNQGYKLTIVGIACRKRLRLKVYRDSYDFQGKYSAECWAKNTGGLDAGWAEVIRFDALAVKLPGVYQGEEEDREYGARSVAQALADAALRLLGAADASIEDAAVELVFI